MTKLPLNEAYQDGEPFEIREGWLQPVRLKSGYNHTFMYIHGFTKEQAIDHAEQVIGTLNALPPQSPDVLTMDALEYKPREDYCYECRQRFKTWGPRILKKPWLLCVDCLDLMISRLQPRLWSILAAPAEDFESWLADDSRRIR